MRFKEIIICFILSSSFLFGQGYGRNVGNDFANSIDSIAYLGEGNFRLRFNFTWSGSGPNYGRVFYAIYKPSKDSLGLEHVIYRWSSALSNYNNWSLKISETNFMFTRQECCSEGDRQGISIRHVDLNRDYEIGEYHMPFQSGSFDPLYHNDSIFILRSIDSTYLLTRQSRQFSNNSHKILCFYDLAKDSLTPLDTIDFGIDFKAPGTLLFDSASQQYELLYDSLQFFFKMGDTLPRISRIHRGSFWHGGRYRSIGTHGTIETYTVNLNRNRFLRMDSCWTVEDTLGYRWVEFCINRNGQVRMDTPPSYPEIPFDGYHFVRGAKLIRGSKFYVASHESNGSLYLLEYKNDSLVDFLFLKESPHKMAISDLHKNEDGSFYLVGNIPIYYGHSNHLLGRVPIFVKVDADGSYQLNQKDREIYFYLSEFGQLFPFLDEPHLDYRYRLTNSSGAMVMEGEIIGREGIATYLLNPGVYNVQLWYQNNGQYLGQGRFIKP
jgi:hypothetical protein